MSKNISIAEGGTSRQFTNDKLKINLVGGGTEYYVPESSVQLGTKSVTANGTYTAASDGKYGFSQFSVNVRGAAGSADSSGKPTTSGGTAPGGVGSAVVGTDPETGNDVAVGVDEDGNLVQTPVPSGIEIVTEPTKTSYTAGETMDYTGLVVKMVNRDGTTFTDGSHPNGHLSLSELVFPVTTAVYTEGADSTATSDYQGNIAQPIAFGMGNVIVERDYSTYDFFNIQYIVETGSPKSIVYTEAQNNSIKIYFVSSAPFSGGVYLCDKTKYSTYIDNRYIESFVGVSSTIHNQTVYIARVTVTQKDTIKNYGAPDYSTEPNDNDLYTLAFGHFEYGSTQEIPVQWTSSYTSDTYEDSFNISVTANNSSGGSGGGGTF